MPSRMCQSRRGRRTLSPSSLTPAPGLPSPFQVESVAPEWLKKYLTAKRQVEAELNACEQIKPVIVRPSFIWTWFAPHQ